MNVDVVIVDDDSVVLFLHKILIQKSEGFSEVHPFESAWDALCFIQQMEGSKPLLVLLDINMPVMNGWEFLDKLQELELKDPVMVAMVTSSINRSDREKAEKYERVIAFLEKPLSRTGFRDLHLQIQQVLSTR